MNKKFEVLDVLENGLTTSFKKGEALAFLGLKTLYRGEEKCFSAKFISDDGYGNFSSQLKKIIGKAPFLKAVEIHGKIPRIVAIGDNEGKEWILVLDSGRCVYTAENPEQFLEQYRDRL